MYSIQKLVLCLIFINFGKVDYVTSPTTEPEPTPDEHVKTSSTTSPANISVFDLFQMPTYNPLEPPPDKEQIMYLDIKVRDAPKLDEGNEKVIIPLKIVMQWPDSRFTVVTDDDSIYIPAHHYTSVWTPPVHIILSREIVLLPPLTTGNHVRFMQVKYDYVGILLEMDVTVSCLMNFQYYPVDRQKCELDFRLGVETANIVLNADISYNGGNETPDYFVTYIEKNVKVEGKQRKERRITHVVTFRRKLGHHILQTYLPSGLLVLLSWLSLYIRPDAVSDRMNLCTVTLLTLVSHFAAVRQDAPKVNYVKALDIWIVSCVLFVVFMLLENIFIINVIQAMNSPEQKANRKPNSISSGVGIFGRLLKFDWLAKQKPSQEPKLEIEASIEQTEELTLNSVEGPFNGKEFQNELNISYARKVDVICLILGFAGFGTFVIWYWTRMLVQKEI